MPHVSKPADPSDRAGAMHRLDDAWLSSALDPGPGNDTLTGTDGDDFFDLSQGGSDTVSGLAGDDGFYFAAAFDGTDRVDGGDGYDFIELAGTYSGLTITGAMMAGIEEIDLDPGGSFDLTIADSVAAGLNALTVFAYSDPTNLSTVRIDGSALTTAIGYYAQAGNDTVTSGAGNDFFRLKNGGTDSFDGGAGFNRISLFGVADGVTFDLGSTKAQAIGTGTVQIRNINDVSGTAGADTIKGSVADNWFLGNGGNDVFTGLAGNDLFTVGVSGGVLPTAVSIDGGRGFDTLDINANYQATAGATITLASTEVQDTGQGSFRIVNVEAITGTTFADTFIGNGLANTLYGADGADHLVGAAGNDTLYGDALYGVDSPNGFDGPRIVFDSPDSAFDDILDGGKGSDTLIGGGGGDTLNGGADADSLSGGLGNDLFVYGSIADSAGKNFDTILDFSSGDRIDLSAIDADTTIARNQAFHLGRTAGHIGDIVVKYDAASDTTIVNLFVDGDAKADATIHLAGQITLGATDFVF